MTLSRSILRGALFAVSLLSVPRLAPSQDDGGIRWLDNYQEALREARQTGKPIFLEFRCEA